MFLRAVLFYLLAFFFTFLLGGIQQAAGINSQLTALPQWGPGVAGLLMLLIFRKDGVKLNFKLKQVSPARGFGALLLPMFPAVLIFPVVWLRQESFSLQYNLSTPLLLLLGSLALGAVGEEIGWRGYLHASLNRSLKPLASSAVVGTLWALWHFGFYQNGPVYVLLAVVAFIATSITMFAVLQDIDFNIWSASLFHYGINLSSLFYLSVINQASYMLLYAVAWVAVAAMSMVWTKQARRAGDHPGAGDSDLPGLA